jgi:hypothetical protein
MILLVMRIEGPLDLRALGIVRNEFVPPVSLITVRLRGDVTGELRIVRDASLPLVRATVARLATAAEPMITILRAQRPLVPSAADELRAFRRVVDARIDRGDRLSTAHARLLVYRLHLLANLLCENTTRDIITVVGRGGFRHLLELLATADAAAPHFDLLLHVCGALVASCETVSEIASDKTDAYRRLDSDAATTSLMATIAAAHAAGRAIHGFLRIPCDLAAIDPPRLLAMPVFPAFFAPSCSAPTKRRAVTWPA